MKRVGGSLSCTESLCVEYWMEDRSLRGLGSQHYQRENTKKHLLVPRDSLFILFTYQGDKFRHFLEFWQEGYEQEAGGWQIPDLPGLQNNGVQSRCRPFSEADANVKLKRKGQGDGGVPVQYWIIELHIQDSRSSHSFGGWQLAGPTRMWDTGLLTVMPTPA